MSLNELIASDFVSLTTKFLTIYVGLSVFDPIVFDVLQKLSPLSEAAMYVSFNITYGVLPLFILLIMLSRKEVNSLKFWKGRGLFVSQRKSLVASTVMCVLVSILMFTIIGIVGYVLTIVVFIFQQWRVQKERKFYLQKTPLNIVRLSGVSVIIILSAIAAQPENYGFSLYTSSFKQDKKFRTALGEMDSLQSELSKDRYIMSLAMNFRKAPHEMDSLQNQLIKDLYNLSSTMGFRKAPDEMDSYKINW